MSEEVKLADQVRAALEDDSRVTQVKVREAEETYGGIVTYVEGCRDSSDRMGEEAVEFVVAVIDRPEEMKDETYQQLLERVEERLFEIKDKYWWWGRADSVNKALEVSKGESQF